jgi:hypothetical protein
MRVLMMVAALAAVSACNRGGSAKNSSNSAKAAESNAAAPATTNAASAAPATAAPAAMASAAGTMPQGFPTNEVESDGAGCVVFLGLSMEANSQAVDHDEVAMQQAADQWRSALELKLGKDSSNQLIGSSVNIINQTPAAQRDAASKWCVENSPSPDPDAG